MKDPKTDASLTYAFAGGLQDFTYVGYMVGTGLGKKVEISVADTLDGVYTVAEVEPSVSDDSTYTYALSDIADSVRYVKLTFKATGYESMQFVLGYAQATVMADEYTKGAVSLSKNTIRTTPIDSSRPIPSPQRGRRPPINRH